MRSGSEMEISHAAFPAWRMVAIGRRVYRVQRQSVFAQGVAQFAHSLRVAITEMLRSAENLHRRKSRLRDFRQQRRAQRLIHKSVCGKDALHSALNGGNYGQWKTRFRQ